MSYYANLKGLCGQNVLGFVLVGGLGGLLKFFFPFSLESSRCTHTEHAFHPNNFLFVKLEECFVTSGFFYCMLILKSNTKMLIQN